MSAPNSPIVSDNGALRGTLRLASMASPGKYADVAIDLNGSILSISRNGRTETYDIDGASIQRVGANNLSIDTKVGTKRYLRFGCGTEADTKQWVKALMAAQSSHAPSQSPPEGSPASARAAAFDSSYKPAKFAASSNDSLSPPSAASSPDRRQRPMPSSPLPEDSASPLRPLRQRSTDPVRRSSPTARRSLDPWDESRAGRLAQVFAMFDNDGSGEVSMAELLEIGKARRSLGQKQGEWTEAMNERFLARLDSDGSGMVSKAEFVAHFEAALPREPGAFSESINQFLAAAKLARDRANKSELSQTLETKTAGGRQVSPPTSRMLQVKEDAQETIRAAKQLAASRLEAQQQPSTAWRHQMLAAVHALLVENTGADPVACSVVMRLNRRSEDPVLMRAFAKFDTAGEVSSAEFVKHFDIMLPGDRAKFGAIVEGFKKEVSSASRSPLRGEALDLPPKHRKALNTAPYPAPPAPSLEHSVASFQKQDTAVEMQPLSSSAAPAAEEAVLATPAEYQSVLCLLLSDRSFASLGFGLFLCAAVLSGMVPLLPVFARGVGASEFHFGVLAGLQPLGHALAFLHAPGHTPSLRISAALLSLCGSCALLALAPASLLALYSARLLQGVGSGLPLSSGVAARASMERGVQRSATAALSGCFLVGGVVGAPLCSSLLVLYGDHRGFGVVAVLAGLLFVAHGLPVSDTGYTAIEECSLQRSADRIRCTPRVSASVLVLLAVNMAMGGFEATYAYFMEEVERDASIQVVGVTYSMLLLGSMLGGGMLTLMPSHELLTIAGLLAMGLALECIPMTAQVVSDHVSLQLVSDGWGAHLAMMTLLGVGHRAANSAAMGAIERAPEGDCEAIETSPMYRWQQVWVVGAIAAGAFLGPVVKHGLNFAAWSHVSGLLLVVVAVLTWFPLALTAKEEEEEESKV